MRPYVELSSIPTALAPQPFSIFFYDFNPAAPSDYSQWGKLVGAFVSHLVDRYGLAEVKNWPFEVWNEPNLPFFIGDQQAYFTLYQYAAEAIKNVDASLKVGGPATSAGQFSLGAPRSPGVQYYREFMQWTVSNKIPVDFGSAHGYESDEGVGPEGPASFFKQNKADTRAGLPLYISETSYSATAGDPGLDQPAAAASFLRTVIETIGVVDALSYWCFSDIFEEMSQASNPFYGGFGLQTIHGVKKPAYRLLQILHGTGDHYAPLTFTGVPASVGGIVVAGQAGRGIDVLLYNHAVPSGQSGVNPTPAQATQVEIAIVNSAGKPAFSRAAMQLIDDGHANAYKEWLAQGSPQYPTRSQLLRLENASALRTTNVPLHVDRPTGRHSFSVNLPAESVVAVHLS